MAEGESLSQTISYRSQGTTDSRRFKLVEMVILFSCCVHRDNTRYTTLHFAPAKNNCKLLKAFRPVRSKCPKNVMLNANSISSRCVENLTAT